MEYKFIFQIDNKTNHIKIIKKNKKQKCLMILIYIQKNENIHIFENGLFIDNYLKKKKPMKKHSSMNNYN